MSHWRTRSWILLATAAVIVIAVSWQMFRPAGAVVQVGTVSEGPLAVSITETGTTRVRAHTDLNAPVAGRWVPKDVRAGDIVPLGGPLGTLYPAAMDASARAQANARVGIADAALRELDARLVAAATSLEEGRRELGRVSALEQAGAVAPRDLERARDAVVARASEVAALRERLRVARHERDIAWAALYAARGAGTGLTVSAPMAGTILRVHEAHERVVVPGAPLLEIGDPRDIEVVVPLLTADALRVRDGAAAALTFGPGLVTGTDDTWADTVRGIVRRVEPAGYTRLSSLGVEEQRVDVLVSVPAAQVHLGDRFRADVRITIWEAPRVVRVPVPALVRAGDGWLVWRMTRGRVSQRRVQLGERGEVYAQVVAGLAPGDSVVLFPDERLADGARVTVDRRR